LCTIQIFQSYLEFLLVIKMIGYVMYRLIISILFDLMNSMIVFPQYLVILQKLNLCLRQVQHDY